MRIKCTRKLSAARYFCRRSFLFHLLDLFFISVFSSASGFAQVAVNYGLFSKDPLGGIQVNLPVAYQIQPVQNVTTSPTSLSPPPNGIGYSGTAHITGNRQPYDPSGLSASTSVEQINRDADIEREQMLNSIYKKALAKEDAIRPYREALESGKIT